MAIHDNATISLGFSFQYFSEKVPPGYTEWYGLQGNSKYYNYSLNENGNLMNYRDAEEDYLTDVLVLKLK